jgi:hypothetical protein
VQLPQIWKNLLQVGVDSVLRALIEGKGFECMKSCHTRIQKSLAQFDVNSVLKSLIEGTGFGSMKSYYMQMPKKRVQEQGSFKVSKELM